VSKIIVGVDESDRSRDAVALAALLARGSDAELVLVCAYPYDDVPRRGANAAYRQSLREDAEAAIESATAGMSELPRMRTHPIAEVSPAKGIQSVAAEEGASLIVIGSSGRGGVGRVFAGTTAERLLHGAPCPVAVAPEGFHALESGDIDTIAVGYDGSVEAKAALVGARSIARVRGARLRLIEVLDATWLGTPALMAGPGPGYVLVPEDAEERARTYLAETAATLADDVPTEPVVAVGAPEQVLADESKSADLVVVGSRGYGPHRAVLLGSVSGRLVRQSASPVLVVPRSIEAPLEELFSPASKTQSV
jgi:nucleotide-binding universal stress UspA family protein